MSSSSGLNCAMPELNLISSLSSGAASDTGLLRERNEDRYWIDTSRGIYLVWNGAIRKLTSDHSPVGEGEDAGELTEEEAMLHPRRNEVFRDVGSRPHTPQDEDFIEIRQCRFRPDAAILLCSDGLTDQIDSARLR